MTKQVVDLTIITIGFEHGCKSFYLRHTHLLNTVTQIKKMFCLIGT